MSHTIHPDWHDTEEPQSNVRTSVRVEIAAEGRSALKRDRRVASRLPAAITGIGVVLMILATIGGKELWLLGQSIPRVLPEGPKTHMVTVTEDGLEPPEITVAPGDRIVIMNTSKTTQIFESATLQDNDAAVEGEEAFLYTPALYEGTDYRFTVPETQPLGEHVVQSIITDEWKFTVTVEGAQSRPDPIDTDSSSSESSDAIENAVPVSITALSSSSSSSTQPGPVLSLSTASSSSSTNGSNSQTIMNFVQQALAEPQSIGQVKLPVNPNTIADNPTGTRLPNDSDNQTQSSSSVPLYSGAELSDDSGMIKTGAESWFSLGLCACAATAVLWTRSRRQVAI